MLASVRALFLERSVRSKVDQLRGLVLASFGPVEPSIWRDPYVMAYVTEVVHGLLKQSAGAQLQPKVRELAFRRCCQRLTGISATDLLQFSADPELRHLREFQSGSNDGLLLLSFLDGKASVRSQFAWRLVEEARMFACKFETDDEETTDPIALIAPYLLTRHLISRMLAVQASRLAPSW